MQLKRGVVRESCNFCHRRKIKCDRQARSSQGHASCSQCFLRQIPCRLEDSYDIRLRRRQVSTQAGRGQRKASSQPLAPNTTVHVDSPRLVDNSLQPLVSDTLDSDALASSLNQASPSYADFLADDLGFLADPFQLTSDNVLFLDRIFAGGHDAAWDSQPFTSMMPGRSEVAEPPSTTAQPSMYDPPPWVRCQLDEAVFARALHAYFDLGAVYLPVVLEDAFWADYHAGTCSLSLVFAVACRGLVFAEGAADAWATQQRLAEQFRTAFFEAQLRAGPADGTILRLDDLEALALMVHGEQAASPSSSSSSSSPLHAQLASLFLTHDALALLTLRSAGISEPAVSSSSSPLTRASDRRTLLFWHVYGLDAFRCLDKKRPSRIPDADDDGRDPAEAPALPHHAARSYLDAILALATLARRALVRLCSHAARRSGVAAGDVLGLYAQLEAWQQQSCPGHLQRQRDAVSGRLDLLANLPAGGGGGGGEKHVPLQRAVVWMLEINCCMQIEACAAEYGIRSSSDSALAGEALALRVEAESLVAVRDAVEVAQQLAAMPGRSLADLAPTIVRDCLAGMGRWVCIRARARREQTWPRLLWERAREGDDDQSRRQRYLQTYRDAAVTLRAAVATATSHSDTQGILEALDSGMAALAAL